MTTTDAKESQLDVDVEKNSPLGAYPIEKKNKKDGVCSYADDDDETGAAAAAAVPGAALVYGNTMYAKINRVADRFRIEARGIERVPDNERTDQGLMQVGTMVGFVFSFLLLLLFFDFFLDGLEFVCGGGKGII